MNILGYNYKHNKSPKFSKWVSMNNQTWTFWQDYFLHMWHAHKARHFEPIEHNFLVKWLKIWVLYLVALSFKISKLWHFCLIFFFIKFIQWTCTFIEWGMLLLNKKFEINSMTLCIPFASFKIKVQFRHLI
jgi:hypothetical protein